MFLQVGRGGDRGQCGVGLTLTEVRDLDDDVCLPPRACSKAEAKVASSMSWAVPVVTTSTRTVSPVERA